MGLSEENGAEVMTNTDEEKTETRGKYISNLD
jgi:hypothetical protein